MIDRFTIPVPDASTHSIPLTEGLEYCKKIASDVKCVLACFGMCGF